jgi:hypothetical protein
VALFTKDGSVGSVTNRAISIKQNVHSVIQKGKNTGYHRFRIKTEIRILTREKICVNAAKLCQSVLIKTNVVAVMPRIYIKKITECINVSLVTYFVIKIKASARNAKPNILSKFPYSARNAKIIKRE